MTEPPSGTLWSEFFVTAEPPGLGPELRTGVLGLQALNHRLNEALREVSLDHPRSELLRALTLLWHDHLDAAHSISQRVTGEDGAYLHGLMHRREPDYWNAKYWFRQAGRHRIHPRLAAQARSLLDEAGEPGLCERLTPGGEWDPFAFVDACQEAEKLAFSAPVRHHLRVVQAAEFALLYGYLMDKPPT